MPRLPGTKLADYVVIVPEGVQKGEKFNAKIGGTKASFPVFRKNSFFTSPDFGAFELTALGEPGTEMHVPKPVE